MSIPTGGLKPTKIGGGFERDSVLTYIDELQRKNNELEDELKEVREASDAEQNELVQDYRRERDDAKRRAVEAEREAEKKIQTAEKKAADFEKKFHEATDKAAKLAEALSTEKKERQADIEKVRQQLTTIKTTTVDASKLKEYQQEIMELKSEISTMSMEANELNAKLELQATQLAEQKSKVEDAEVELEDLNQSLDAKDDEIASKSEEISSLKARNAKCEAELTELRTADKNQKEQIKKLEEEVQELKNRPVQTVTADMFGGWMTDIAKDAENRAKERIEKANKEAEEIEKEASEAAEALLAEAEERASTAHAEAEKLFEETRRKAEEAASDKVKKAEEAERRTYELTAKVQTMLLSKIAGMEENLQNIQEAVTQAMEGMTDKLDETSAILEKAKQDIHSGADVESPKPVQKSAPELKKPEPAPAPKKPEPVPEIKKPEPAPAPKKPEPVPEIKKPEPAPELKKPEPVPEIKKPEPVPAPKKPEPVPEVKPAPKPVASMASSLNDLLAEAEQSVGVGADIPLGKPVQPELSVPEVPTIPPKAEKKPQPALDIPDLFSLAAEAENKPQTPPVQQKPAPKPVASMASSLNDLLAEAEQSVGQKAADPALDLFNIQEQPPASESTFQPEKEEIMDIDSFSRSGGMMAFNTKIQARATNPPQQKKKKGGDDFSWDDLVAENNAANRKKKKKSE